METMNEPDYKTLAAQWQACVEKSRKALVECEDALYAHAPTSLARTLASEALAEYARCSSEQPATGWHDISTAPKDGTKIRIAFWKWNKPNGEYSTAEASWMTDENDEEGFGDPDREILYHPPTHWQPLPPAPQAVKGEQQG